MFLRKRSVERPNPSVRNRMLGYFFNRLMYRDLDCFRHNRGLDRAEPSTPGWTIRTQERCRRKAIQPVHLLDSRELPYFSLESAYLSSGIASKYFGTITFV